MTHASIRNVSQNKAKKPAPQYDPIFFRKVDIEVGTELLYKGRLAPDTLWRVVRIMSDQGIGKGMRAVPAVRKLRDSLIVRNKAGETREITFAYASYSAIWRMPRAPLRRVQ